MTPAKIYFVAGEASGDNHGAGLMRALRMLEPDLVLLGRGGPQMRAVASSNFEDWIRDAAVLGLWEVVKHYNYFRRKFRETLDEIAREKPDAVVLIDYPGFNLRLARVLHESSPGLKVIYYVSPQVWAWRRGRIKKMARWLDLMLCIFPFEADLYNRSGLRTIFVGHPMIERLSAERIEDARDPNLVALFPGSRSREVRKIFPVMLEIVRRVQLVRPSTTFAVAAASSELAHELKKMTDTEGSTRQKIQIRVGDSARIMRRAFAGVIASGSATQEAAFFRLPFILIYKVSWLTYVAGKAVVVIDYLGMPNVLAGREIVPEFIQYKAKAGPMTKALLALMENQAARDGMIAAFDQITASLGEGGASMRAAQAVMDEIAPAKVGV